MQQQIQSRLFTWRRVTKFVDADGDALGTNISLPAKGAASLQGHAGCHIRGQDRVLQH